MKKRNILLTLVLAMAAGIRAAVLGGTLTSPGGKLAFTMEQRDGKLLYSIIYNGAPVITDGQLGVSIDNHLVESAMGIPTDTAALWTEHLRLTGIDTVSVDTVWMPVYGENSRIRDRYRQQVYHFVKGGDAGGDTDGYNKRRQYLPCATISPKPATDSSCT